MKRTRAVGFEANTTYNRTATDGNITVTTGSKRTGTYGLDVNAQSGVKSTLQIDNHSLTLSPPENMYGRLYINFQTLPASDRILFIIGAASAGTNVVEFKIKSTGAIEMRVNNVLKGTSSTSLSTSRWYCLEYGFIPSSKYCALRIDGNMEIDWVATGSSLGLTGLGIHIGACDTVAAAFHYYVDDIAFDARFWPGPGRVKRLGVTGIKVDNAAFSAVGAATKWQAINEITPDDDTSYLLSSTTGQTITFSVAVPDADVKQVNGVSVYAWAKRDGATNASHLYLTQTGDYQTVASASGALPSQNAQATYLQFHQNGLPAYGPLGPFFDVSQFADFAIGIVTTSANAARWSALWCEIDYNDSGASYQHATPVMICNFDDGANDFLATSNGQVTGTVVASTDFLRLGPQSLKVTHAAAGQSRARHSFQREDWYTTAARMEYSVWFRTTALPSSGSMGILGYITNVALDFDVRVTSTGVITSNFRVIAGSDVITAPAGTIAIDTWYHLRVQMQIASANATKTDGFCKVWVDGVLVHHKTGANPGTTNDSATLRLPYLGSAINVAGGSTVYYSGYILDTTLAHDQHTKFATLQPTAAGALTDAGFVATGAANKWDCLDDIVNDGDTTYVTTPLSSTLKETYVTTDIDARALTIYGFGYSAVSKRATSNLSFLYGVKDTTRALTQTSGTGNAGAAYAGDFEMQVWNEYGGEWDAAAIDALELLIGANSGSLAARITRLAMCVCYNLTTVRGRSRNGGLGMVG